jgi:hypothetical protein
MFITFAPTPFRTVHSTATGPAAGESQLKGQQTRHAKARGLGEMVSRRVHTIGAEVTVFSIYRKA